MTFEYVGVCKTCCQKLYVTEDGSMSSDNIVDPTGLLHYIEETCYTKVPSGQFLRLGLTSLRGILSIEKKFEIRYGTFREIRMNTATRRKRNRVEREGA